MTSMFLRNPMAMDTEQMMRDQPMDAAVLIGGCDQTLPAQMMAAALADVPAVFVPVGPMLVGHHRGETLGACTDCRRLRGEFRAGRMTAAEIEAVNDRLAPTPGTRMVMGTASTMACIVEIMGLALMLSATIPATHADRLRSAAAIGRAAWPCCAATWRGAAPSLGSRRRARA
jgi:dihydroxy-acid dehydratase